MRALIVALLLVLGTAAAAPAQEPEMPPGCERGPGTDADYAYCPDPQCDEDSTDADYVYDCVSAHGTPTSGPAPRRRPRVYDRAVQALPAQTLPVTGADAVGVAAAGLGLLLCGAGLRLRVRGT